MRKLKKRLKFKVGDRVEVYKDLGGNYSKAVIDKVRPHVSSEYKYVVRYDGDLVPTPEKESNLVLIKEPKEPKKASGKTLKKSDIYKIAIKFYTLGIQTADTNEPYLEDDTMRVYADQLIKDLTSNS